MSEKAQRVLLHVGVPKSGTTFLQASLAKNRAELRENGVLYPDGKQDLMFRAALDVRGNYKAWGRKRSVVVGSWDEICHKARRFPGTTVISHELLAAATSHQIAAAMTMLAGLDVHLVATARDPARQATAEWQEGIKHGRTQTFEEFRERVLAGDSSDDAARRFAAAQDLPRVLARWGGAVPPENVHVVCCPPPDTDRHLLWAQLADVVGFDADAYDVADGAANASLGVVEIDLLRRVNVALGGRLVQPEYGRVVKHYLAKRLLTAHRSARPCLPAEMYDDLVRVGQQWAKEIDRAGYTVHGDLEHLVPVPPQDSRPHPDDVDPHAEVATAASVLAEVLVELEQTQARVAELEADTKKLKKKRKSLKRKLAEALEV